MAFFARRYGIWFCVSRSQQSIAVTRIEGSLELTSFSSNFWPHHNHGIDLCDPSSLLPEVGKKFEGC